MLVINLFGGPGSGKTTTATGLFHLLRHQWTTNTELVTEFATDLCFERARDNLKNQVYLLGNQYHRLWRLQQIGVHVAVTDAPLALNHVYSKIYAQPYDSELCALTNKLNQQFDNINILMNRDPNAIGGFKGGKKSKDAWFVKRFDDSLASCGLDFDATIDYSPTAPDLIMRWLKLMTSRDNLARVQQGYWKT